MDRQLLFCSTSNKINKKVIDVWIYNATDNTLRPLTPTSSINSRHSMSIVAINKTTAILFGGRNSSGFFKTTFNETWIMHFQPVFKWRQATGDIVHSLRPSARFDHAAVIMQSKMYVFGGQSASGDCLDDLWVFDVNTKRWSELIVDIKGPNVSNGWLCEYSAASTPGQPLITVKQHKQPKELWKCLRKHSCSPGYRLETWMFIVSVKMWHLVGTVKLTNYLPPLERRPLLKSFYWKGFLITFDQNQIGIKYLAVRYPAGFTSSNISGQQCDFCRKGYYRETIFSDPDCIPCPRGLTTAKIGASKIEECTVCNKNR